MNVTRSDCNLSSTKPLVRMTPVLLLVCLAMCQFTASRVAASVVIDIVQIGGNVVATARGTIDLAGLTKVLTTGATAGVIQPDIAYIILGTSGRIDVYGTIAGPSSWGRGSVGGADADSGDIMAITSGQHRLAVPAGYKSGSLLMSSDTWDGATFSSLGLNPGTYTYTWGSGSTADSETVQIGPLASVPEPVTIWLAAIGAAGFAAHARFTRSKKKRREGQTGPSRVAV